MPKVTANPDVCVGYGMCAMNFPEGFELDHTNTVVVRREFTEAEFELVETAVTACPTGALSLDRTVDSK